MSYFFFSDQTSSKTRGPSQKVPYQPKEGVIIIAGKENSFSLGYLQIRVMLINSF